MRKNMGFLVILGVATLAGSGCLRRVTGPCYGVGCPVLTSSSQPKVAQVPQPSDPNAPAQTAAQAQPAAAANSPADAAQAQPTQAEASQPKQGRFTRMLTALHLHSKS
jgi:hypothetical protein